MKIRCIAVDDEPPGLNLIKSYIEKTPFLSLEGAYSNPIEAMADAKKHDIQLAFLDINMPDLDGMQLSRLLPENCKVIFITAYEEYALESYRVAALDYLIKPVSYEDFLGAANKALEFFELDSGESKESKDFFFVKADYKIHKIFFDDILYCKSDKDYIQIYLDDDGRLMPLMSLKGIEKVMPSHFMKVHRSFIVNLNKIKIVERNRIVFGDEYIPVSDAYKEEFHGYLKGKSVN